MYQECEAVMNRLLSLRRELSGDKSKQAKNVMYQIDRFEDEWGNIVIKSRAKESAQLQELQNAQRLRIGGLMNCGLHACHLRIYFGNIS